MKLGNLIEIKSLQNEAFLAAANTWHILATRATLIAAVTATLAALATTCTRGFTGEGAIHSVLIQPIMMPEIVLAISFLILIAQVKQITG